MINTRKSTKKNYKKRAPHGKYTQSQMVARAPPRVRFMGTLFPEEVDTVLSYQTTVQLKNAANFYWAYPLFTNAPYDVDPSLGSTATLGMVEFSAAYLRYRVLRYTTEIRFTNVGIFPTQVVVVHSNTAISAAGGSAVNLEPYIGNKFTQKAVLGHAYSGTSQAVLTSKRSITEISGTNESLTDITYSAQVTTVPSNLTYLEIGAYVHDPAGSYLTSGVTAMVIVRMDTRFSERKNLTT